MVVTSLGNLLTGLVAVCVGQLSADLGTSKSKGNEALPSLRAEGVGHGAPSEIGAVTVRGPIRHDTVVKFSIVNAEVRLNRNVNSGFRANNYRRTRESTWSLQIFGPSEVTCQRSTAGDARFDKSFQLESDLWKIEVLKVSNGLKVKSNGEEGRRGEIEEKKRDENCLWEGDAPTHRVGPASQADPTSTRSEDPGFYDNPIQVMDCLELLA
ncbi:hypothetical protein Sjap_009877 [Stephania japonica]|uniref:Uncharacterized protein n=1 Tax=Stephania japonica TaxID=461633 RepID=A0AAP0JA45_9MAGN